MMAHSRYDSYQFETKQNKIQRKRHYNYIITTYKFVKK